MQRLLITGASGFIGKHVLDQLLDHPCEIHAVSRYPCNAPVNVNWHLSDLLVDDPGKLIHDIQPTHLLHMAWDVTHGACWQSDANEAWYQASLRLLDAFIEHGGQRAVVCGTCAEYDWQDGLCNEETTPLSDDTAYARYKCKLLDELKNRPVSWGWARPFWVYGPGEPAEKIVSSTVINLINDQPAICKQPHLQRDMVYVADVAKGLIILLDQMENGIVNLGTGQAVPLLKIMQEVGRQLNRPDLILSSQAPDLHQSPQVVADPQKSENWLGWTCNVNLQDGIMRTIHSIVKSSRDHQTAMDE